MSDSVQYALQGTNFVNQRTGVTAWWFDVMDAWGEPGLFGFNSTTGFDGADDFGNALLAAVGTGLDDDDRSVMVTCEYVDATDTYRVVYGDYSIPLSITEWR